MKRIKAQRRPSRGALFVLAGGPGQSATQAFEGDGLGVLSPAFRRRDLIVFDQRGTGRSGLLRCRALERSNLFDAGSAAGACARRLGARRFHYTSRDSVEDIEALRAQLGIDKIALYGTSYGVKVALGYALTYPAHVERLVLDSVLDVDGPDPFYAPTLEALPRVLRALCRAGCCSFTADPLEDLRRVVRRMGTRGVRGQVVDERGRRRPARVSRSELFLMLIAGDFDPALRAALPGAVRAALDGDSAPLVRLGRRSFSVEGEPPPPRLLSTALFTATTCEEMRFPWARTAPPDPAERHRQAAAAAALVPSRRSCRSTAPRCSTTTCSSCATGGPPPRSRPPSGLGRCRTCRCCCWRARTTCAPPSRARAGSRPASRRSELVVAPATGHSALGADPSGCAERAFARFFRNQSVASSCGRGRRDFPPAPPPPRALRRVAPVPGLGGTRGRALAAVAMTLRDVGEDALTRFVFDERDPDIARGGGLRGGRYRIDGRNRLHLTRVEFVPRVRVSGLVRRFGGRGQSGRLRLAGRVDGALALDGRRVRGRLGGRRVRAVLATRVATSGLRAAAARLPAPSGP